VHVKGADAPDGQYVPAGHAQRLVDRGEGLFGAGFRCHELPQIDDVLTFDPVKTVGKTKKAECIHSQRARKEEERTLIKIL
jgi:hypothetical protein